MIKKTVVFVVNWLPFLTIAFVLLLVFVTLCPPYFALTIQFPDLTILLLIGTIALILRRLVIGQCVRYPFLDRLAEKIATSRPLRTRIIGATIILIGILILAPRLQPLEKGLTGRYYDNTQWNGEPILETLDPVISLQRMRKTFPQRSENYSIEWEGTLMILCPGKYRFTTISDDGSELWIDGQLVVDNRGLHGPIEQTGKIHLNPGVHTLTLRYMQGTVAALLKASWKRSGSSRLPLSKALLLPHPPSFLALSTELLLDLLFIISAFGLILLTVGASVLLISRRDLLMPLLRQSRASRFLRKYVFVSPADDAAPRAPSKGLRPHVLAFGAYLIISLIWTYPLIAKFSTAMFGLGGDRYIHLWNMWWMKKALLELHTNPFFTDYLMHPAGISLAFHDFSPFNALLSVPLQAFFSLGEMYNLLFLSTFVLGGFGGFLLVRYLTGNNLAAFVAGLIFAFWGGRVYYVDHLSLASIQWFPYCALYTLKTLRESSYRYPLLAALFLAFNALSCSTYAVFMSLFAGLLVLYFALTESRRFFTIPSFTRLLVLGVIFILLVSPMLYPMLKQMFAGQDYMNSPLLAAESASPNVIFFPNVNHAILGKYVRAWYEKAGHPVQWGLAGGSFIGYTVIILCLYTGVKLQNKQTVFWIIAVLSFLLLALGPYLMLFSKHYTWIPLPYLLLQKVPILKILRVPIRFMVLVMFCCSVLAGYACREVFRRLRFPKVGCALLVLLILFEFLRVYFVTPVEKTPPFYSKLGHDPDDYAILEITKLMNWQHSAVRSSLFQITHQKRLFHGHVTRISFDTYYQAYALYPIFDDLFTQPEKYLISAPNPGISLQNRQTAIRAALSFYNVRYVTLYDDYWHGNYRENRQRLADVLGPPVAEQPGMTFFKVKQTPLTKTIVFPGFGTEPLIFKDHAIPYRKTSRDTEIKILNVDKRAIRLQFQAKNFASPAEDQFDVVLNGAPLATVTIRDWTEVDLPPLPLVPGENTLKLRMPNTLYENWNDGMYLRNMRVTFED